MVSATIARPIAEQPLLLSNTADTSTLSSPGLPIPTPGPWGPPALCGVMEWWGEPPEVCVSAGGMATGAEASKGVGGSL